MADGDAITIKVIGATSEIEANAWNSLANPTSDSTYDFDYNPFLSHDFYNSLENSGSADRHTGWLPQHLVMEQNDAVIGIRIANIISTAILIGWVKIF